MFTTLTLVINAPTTGIILKKLGLLNTSVQQELMRKNHQNTLALSTRDFYLRSKKHMMFDSYIKDVVTSVLEATMEGDEEKLDHKHLENTEFLDAMSFSRDAFLRILNAEYWILTDHGMLSSSTDVLLTLLASVDHAKDHVASGLADWGYLDRVFKRETWFANKCGVYTNIVSRFIRTGLQENVTMTTICYIGALTEAMSRAHRHMTGDCLEQVTKEAQQNLQSAQDFLATLDQDDVSMLKTWQLCRTMLDFQRDKVHRWELHGVLTGGEAHEMLHHVNHGESLLGHQISRYLRKTMSAIHPIGNDDCIPTDTKPASQEEKASEDTTGEVLVGTQCVTLD